MKAIMSRLNKYRHLKTMRISWFVSYMLIVCVPIMLSVFMFAYNNRVMSNHIKQIQEDSVEKLKDIYDGMMETVHIIVKQIVENPKIREYIEYESMDSGDGKLSLQSTFEYLQSQLTYGQGIKDIYVFSANSKYIISPRNASNEKNSKMFDYYKIFNKSEDELWTLLESSNQPIMMLEDGVGQQHLYYFYVVALDDIRRADGWILVELDFASGYDNSENIMEGIRLQDGTFYWFKQNSNAVERVKQKDISENIESDDSIIFAKVDSRAENWEYFCCFDAASLFQSINQSKGIYICFIIISYVLAIVFAQYLTRRQYSPIQKLVQAIDQQKPFEIGNESEFDYLQKAFWSMAEERHVLKKQVDKERDVIVNNIFSRIIKGYYVTEAEIENNLDQYQILFPNYAFRLILYSIDDYSEAFFDRKAENNMETYGIIHFTIKNIVIECMKEHFDIIYCVESDNFISLIINYNDAEEDRIEDIIVEKNTKAKKFLKEKLNIAVTWFSSTECTKLIYLNKCYSECLEYMGNQDRINREIDNNIQNQRELKFINYLQNDNFNAAKAMLREILQECELKGKESVAFRLYLLHLLTQIKDLIENDTRYQGICDESRSLHILNCIDNVQISGYLMQIIEEMQDRVNAKKAESPPRAKVIREYIDMHYLDSNLSLSLIANQFHISEGYVTQLMKKQYNIRIAQYISEKRIEHVKYLMKDSSLNINDIAAQSGFYSYRTMIRVFKQVEGVTPTEYRKNNE